MGPTTLAGGGGGEGSMADNGRASLRSSARLSTSAGGGGGGGGGRSVVTAQTAGARAAEAARRRQRAAERAREVEDSPRVVRDKCRLLARALRNAKHLVVYTGAGISTAADIPDYRGPQGVWTRLRQGETVGRVEVSRARPTLTHMALTALWARGTLKFVVSQNCDGLHVRAGLPRRALAELHGDMFAERCAACRKVYLRAFDTTERTARHQHGTRRLCHGCGAELTDTIVHFGERGRAAWPLNWAGALRHAAAADVVLCLGSSLKVLRRYPRLWRMHRAPHARPRLYIVNLQWTPKDAVAALKINARCDEVMALVARRLRLRVPPYCPSADPLLAHAVPLAAPEAHTTRRPTLSPPAPLGSPHPLQRRARPASPSDSPSPSDSDEELPLRRLAERMRAPAPAPAPTPLTPAPAEPALPPPPPLPPPPDLLHAFQVSLAQGEARILLRAHHAPSVRPPASPPPPPPPLAQRRVLSELRRFRMSRAPRPPAPSALTASPPAPPPAPPLLTNGHARVPNGAPSPLALPNGWLPKCGPNNNIQCQIKCEQDYKMEVKCEQDTKWDVKFQQDRQCAVKFEQDSKCAVKLGADRKDVDGEGAVGGMGGGCVDAEASALAAAIIARAVLLCRGSLYPGLHTILAGCEPSKPNSACTAARTHSRATARLHPRPQAEGGECPWCWRRLGARRCQWYGPPPADVLARRAWRRVRGRRYLCACCPDGSDRPPRDTGGWYGKGYRKGRRPPRKPRTADTHTPPPTSPPLPPLPPPR